MKKMMNMKRILLLSLLSTGAHSAYAQEDILSKYRSQGGMLTTEQAAQATQEREMVDPITEFLSDGTNMSDEKIEGFNAAIDQAFPMTPEMIRQYRKILEENQRAAQERPEPKADISTTLVSLEPGEPAPVLVVSPSIASVIGFYDATGAAWPITEYVLGNSNNFQAVHLGEESNNLVLTPQARLGFTNVVVLLKGQDKPVTVRVNISEEVADYRYDVQVMRLGPNAEMNNASSGIIKQVTESGSTLLLAALTAVDLPSDAKPVEVIGVNARAWMIGEDLYVRSKDAMLSPSWTESMSGPDGVRVYKIAPASVALFSVNGQIVRADLKLP